jgi:hypothetical protein
VLTTINRVTNKYWSIVGQVSAVDSIDRDILRIMATKGCTSAYAVWVQMKAEDDNVMVYKNIGRRVLLLQEGGFLEEVKLEGVENLHGRKDYKLTIKGLEQLIPYVMTHIKEIQKLTEYMVKFDINRNLFGVILLEQLTSMIRVVNEYQKYKDILYNLDIEMISDNEVGERYSKISKKFESSLSTLLDNTLGPDYTKPKIESGTPKLEAPFDANRLKKKEVANDTPTVEEMELDEMSRYSKGVETTADRKKKLSR